MRGCEEKATISGPSPGSGYLPPDSWSWITDVLRWLRSIKKTQVSVLKVQRLKHHNFLLREAVETGCLSALPRLSTAGKPPTCRAGDQKRECRAACVVVLLPCVAALRCCLVTLPFAAAFCCCLLLLPFAAAFRCCFCCDGMSPVRRMSQWHVSTGALCVHCVRPFSFVGYLSCGLSFHGFWADSCSVQIRVLTICKINLWLF